MVGYIGKKQWQRFIGAINKVSNDFNSKEITWLRFTPTITEFNEDQDAGGTYTPVKLLVLQNHNYMRTWPINRITTNGEVDKQSIQLYINKKYLKDNGYLTPSNNLDYQPDYDRFILDGITYKPIGDGSASQADGIDMHFLLVLKREEFTTSDNTLR